MIEELKELHLWNTVFTSTTVWQWIFQFRKLRFLWVDECRNMDIVDLFSRASEFVALEELHLIQ